MSALDTAGEWVEEHKPAAAAIGLAAVAFLWFARRRAQSANGTSGALAAGVGGQTLVPYGDATSLGFTGLTDATAQGFAGLSDSLNGITGLLSSLPISQLPAVTGGSETGNTVPTPGGAGSSPNGQTATPPFAPSTVPVPALTPTPAAPPVSLPPMTYTNPLYMPATDPNNLPANYPTTVQPAPTYQSAPVSADYFTASQPGATLGMPAGARYIGTYDEKSVQTLLNGGIVLNGGVSPYKLVPGTNYAVPA